jgi:hypothetical protein
LTAAVTMLRAALLLATAAVLGSAHADPPATVVRAEGEAIVFQGRIDEPSVREFLRLADDRSLHLLVIRSAGGLVGAALDMAEAVRARGLDVEVDQFCLSSCANYVFPAARRKWLSGPATVGWHGDMEHVLYRAQRGDEHWSEEALAQARALAVREDAFFRSIGVDGFVCWFGKIAPYEVEGFYTLSVADMAGFGIRDVSVRDPDAPPVSPDLERIAVDWTTLESLRPAVQLQLQQARGAGVQ